MSEQVRKLQSRIGQLNDRIGLLENRLADTQDKVQHDVKHLTNLFIEVQKTLAKTKNR